MDNQPHDIDIETETGTPRPGGSWRDHGELAFQVFCATIFLGMIGLVFVNAVLRYGFNSSFPPTEEWARFLFLYITFFGAIEAFYRRRHIAVEMVVGKLHGTTRRTVDIIALLLTLFALGLMFVGGVQLVRQTMDTYSVATHINMTYVNGILPIMALAALLIHFRQLMTLIRSRDRRPDPDVCKNKKNGE